MSLHKRITIAAYNDTYCTVHNNHINYKSIVMYIVVCVKHITVYRAHEDTMVEDDLYDR